jgi:tRNA(Ile)-lysidine synthase
MIEQVKQFIITNNLITPTTRTVLAAVSGGIDSCVLLDMLFRLRKALGYDLNVVHFNHKVRGESSYQDEEFVKEIAKKYGLPIHVGRLRGKPNKMSETLLREERLKFYHRILAKAPQAIIATGHNLDDNVETFLMRLAKGSRVKGLLAIRPVQGAIIHPILNLPRSDIDKYAKLHGIKYREDITNQDTTILRNRIRHEILPYLRKNLNKNISQNLVKTIQDLANFYEIYEYRLKEAITQSTRTAKNGIHLNRKRYQQYKTAIRRGLIEYCISVVYPLNYNVSDNNLTMWDDFVQQAQPGKRRLFFDQGMALAERNHIIFGKIPEERKHTYRLKLGSTLQIEPKYQIGFNKISAKDVKFSSNRNIEYIDGSKSGDNLMVRFWRKGDRFKPLGMGNRRKLSDFFIDLKLSTPLKKEIPIICQGDQIIWIAGYRLDDRFKISEQTKKFYKLELKKITET